MERQIAHATSRDGTPIGFERGGEGPPIVMVHGTSSDRTSFAFVRPLLEERFAVVAVDRRGRGESGDADSYELEREFEDVAAVVRAAGHDAVLFGHSYGAMCALEAALLLEGLAGLVLYEPLIGDPLSPPGGIERLELLLERGEREELLVTFLREDAQLSETEIAELRAAPTWERRLAAAHTVPRELRAEAAWSFGPERFAEMRTPTLMLLGSESPAWARRATQVVAASLPDCRVRVLPRQGHAATITAPELLAGEVEAFIESLP